MKNGFVTVDVADECGHLTARIESGVILLELFATVIEQVDRTIFIINTFELESNSNTPCRRAAKIAI